MGSATFWKVKRMKVSDITVVESTVFGTLFGKDGNDIDLEI